MKTILTEAQKKIKIYFVELEILYLDQSILVF